MDDLLSKEQLDEIAAEAAETCGIGAGDIDGIYDRYWDVARLAAESAVGALGVVRVIESQDGDIWGVKVQACDLRDGAVLVRTPEKEAS